MSDTARAWCWDHSPFSGAKFIVHFAMADTANDTNDNRLWMTDKTLAKKARTTSKTVQRARDELIGLGMLERIGAPPAPSRPAEYRFLMPPVNGGHPVHSNGGHLDPNGGHPVPNGGHLVDPHLLPTKGTKGTKEYAHSQNSEPDPMVGFDHFWETYPSRNGRRVGKAKAAGFWSNLSLEEKRAAYRGAVNYARDCDADLQRAQDAFRWLRDRLWTDWQEPTDHRTVKRKSDPTRRSGGGKLARLTQEAAAGDAARQMELTS